MTNKWYNKQEFQATVNGREYTFACHTTSTRNGFCHTVQTSVLCKDASQISGIQFLTAGGTMAWFRDTKVSYINRTWERFDYETALKSAIAKCPKEDREQLTAVIIERTDEKERERCDKFFNAFKSLHDSLNEENKKKVAEITPNINTEGQAKAVMGVMALMKAMQ